MKKDITKYVVCCSHWIVFLEHERYLVLPADAQVKHIP